MTGTLVRLAIVALIALTPTLAHAQADGADVIDSGDTAFVLGCALLALALLMPGIVLHHGGQLRARAFAALATETLAITAVVCVAWVVVGYTLAFGMVGNGWLGSGNAWMLIDLGDVRAGTAVPEIVFVALQLGFAVLAASLLTGAWAERGNLAWIVVFGGMWSLMVYAPLAHWIWGGGWLASRLGTFDQGGALVVHASVGISALVITLLLGPRLRLDDDAPGALALAGGGMVWAALLVLTVGSTLTASDDAGAVLVNLQVAAATGALVWLLLDGITLGRANPPGLARGALAGLVAASAAAQAMAPGGAMLAGLGGVLVAWTGARLIRSCGIDDAVDLVAVHGLAGLTGALIAVPLISATLGGTGYAPNIDAGQQLIAQALGAGAVVAWSAIGTAIAALMVATIIPMRSRDADE